MSQTVKADTHRIYEKVAAQLVQHLGDLSEFSYSALQLLPFPLQFKNIFFAELRREAREELRRFKSERFLFGHSSLEPYRNALADAAAATSVLSRDDCIRLIQHTARLQWDYLTRPQHFLCKHIYAESYELSADAIRQALAPFTEYQYLTEVLLQYLSRKQVASLSDERFEKLIADIDKKVCATYHSAEWSYLLEPLYAYYALGGELKIPITVLQVFLREKDALAALHALMHLREHGIDELAHADIALLFEGDLDALLRKKKSLSTPPEFKETLVAHLARQLAEEALSESPTAASSALPDVSGEDTAAALPQTESPASTATFSKSNAVLASPDFFAAPPHREPLPSVASASPVKDTQDAATSSSAPNAETEVSAPHAAPDAVKQPDAPASTTASVQAASAAVQHPISAACQTPNTPPPPKASLSDHTLPAKPPKSISRSDEIPLPVSNAARLPEQRSLADLRALITVKDRKKIIKRVFKGSELEYEKAITELNQKKTWREASLYLDREVFKRFNVDEYSMEAMLLTDTVFERHFRKP